MKKLLFWSEISGLKIKSAKSGGTMFFLKKHGICGSTIKVAFTEIDIVVERQ